MIREALLSRPRNNTAELVAAQAHDEDVHDHFYKNSNSQLILNRLKRVNRSYKLKKGQRPPPLGKRYIVDPRLDKIAAEYDERGPFVKSLYLDPRAQHMGQTIVSGTPNSLYGRMYQSEVAAQLLDPVLLKRNTNHFYGKDMQKKKGHAALAAALLRRDGSARGRRGRGGGGRDGGGHSSSDDDDPDRVVRNRREQEAREQLDEEMKGDPNIRARTQAHRDREQLIREIATGAQEQRASRRRQEDRTADRRREEMRERSWERAELQREYDRRRKIAADKREARMEVGKDRQLRPRNQPKDQGLRPRNQPAPAGGREEEKRAPPRDPREEEKDAVNQILAAPMPKRQQQQKNQQRHALTEDQIIDSFTTTTTRFNQHVGHILDELEHKGTEIYHNEPGKGRFGGRRVNYQGKTYINTMVELKQNLINLARGFQQDIDDQHGAAVRALEAGTIDEAERIMRDSFERFGRIDGEVFDVFRAALAAQLQFLRDELGKAPDDTTSSEDDDEEEKKKGGRKDSSSSSSDDKGSSSNGGPSSGGQGGPDNGPGSAGGDGEVVNFVQSSLYDRNDPRDSYRQLFRDSMGPPANRIGGRSRSRRVSWDMREKQDRDLFRRRDGDQDGDPNADGNNIRLSTNNPNSVQYDNASRRHHRRGSLNSSNSSSNISFKTSRVDPIAASSDQHRANLPLVAPPNARPIPHDEIDYQDGYTQVSLDPYWNKREYYYDPRGEHGRNVEDIIEDSAKAVGAMIKKSALKGIKGGVSATKAISNAVNSSLDTVNTQLEDALVVAKQGAPKVGSQALALTSNVGSQALALTSNVGSAALDVAKASAAAGGNQIYKLAKGSLDRLGGGLTDMFSRVRPYGTSGTAGITPDLIAKEAQRVADAALDEAYVKYRRFKHPNKKQVKIEDQEQLALELEDQLSSHYSPEATDQIWKEADRLFRLQIDKLRDDVQGENYSRSILSSVKPERIEFDRFFNSVEKGIRDKKNDSSLNKIGLENLRTVVQQAVKAVNHDRHPLTNVRLNYDNDQRQAMVNYLTDRYEALAGQVGEVNRGDIAWDKRADMLSDAGSSAINAVSLVGNSAFNAANLASNSAFFAANRAGNIVGGAIANVSNTLMDSVAQVRNNNRGIVKQEQRPRGALSTQPVGFYQVLENGEQIPIHVPKVDLELERSIPVLESLTDVTRQGFQKMLSIWSSFKERLPPRDQRNVEQIMEDISSEEFDVGQDQRRIMSGAALLLHERDRSRQTVVKLSSKYQAPARTIHDWDPAILDELFTREDKNEAERMTENTQRATSKVRYQYKSYTDTAARAQHKQRSLIEQIEFIQSKYPQDKSLKAKLDELGHATAQQIQQNNKFAEEISGLVAHAEDIGRADYPLFEDAPTYDETRAGQYQQPDDYFEEQNSMRAFVDQKGDSGRQVLKRPFNQRGAEEEKQWGYGEVEYDI